MTDEQREKVVRLLQDFLVKFKWLGEHDKFKERVRELLRELGEEPEA